MEISKRKLSKAALVEILESLKSIFDVNFADKIQDKINPGKMDLKRYISSRSQFWSDAHYYN